MQDSSTDERPSTVMRVAPLATGVLTMVFAYVGTHQDGSRNSAAPSTTDSADKVVTYFRAHTGGTGGGAFSLLLAAILGLFFYGLVRQRLTRSSRSDWLATVGFSGAVILAVAALVQAGVDFALNDIGARLNTTTAQVLNVLQNDLNQMMIQAGVTVLMVGFGLALWRSGPFRWLAWPTVGIGVLASAGPLIALALPLAGVWILVVAALMFTGPRQSRPADVQAERVDVV
jgi:hypothetical protein